MKRKFGGAGAEDEGQLPGCGPSKGNPRRLLVGTTNRGLRGDGLPLAQPSPDLINAGRGCAVPVRHAQKPGKPSLFGGAHAFQTPERAARRGTDAGPRPLM